MGGLPILFSKKTLKETARINELISHYHTKEGLRIDPVGFYQNDKGEWLIDRLTSEGRPFAKCNACQTYNVETYKLVGDTLKLYRVREYKRD